MDNEIKDAIAFDLHLNFVGPLFLDVTKDVEESFDWMIEISSYTTFDAFLVSLDDVRKKEIVNTFRNRTDSKQLFDSDIIFISKLIYSFSSKTLFHNNELVGYYDFVIRCVKDRFQKRAQGELILGKTISDSQKELLDLFTDTRLGEKGLEGNPLYVKHFFESEKAWSRKQLLEFWKSCYIDLSLPEISEVLKKEIKD